MTARPHEKDDEPEPAGDLSEAEWDRILPPIDEDDPEWQAYVRRKVRESLDDPRPSIPAAEARRHMRELHEEQLKRQAKKLTSDKTRRRLATPSTGA